MSGYWYVTTNVWVIEASRSYDRVVIRARAGSTGRAITSVRNGDPVGINWNNDGTAGHAGRATEVEFSFQTAIVVVAPPSGSGVGDTDGNADERSPA